MIDTTANVVISKANEVFLKINSDYTLIQETLIRIKNNKIFHSPILICNNEHRFLIAEQLRELRIKPKLIILEPIGKNTAAAITVTSLIVKKINENAKILIEAGAFDLAIEQLQLATADNPDPDDLYNLGLCFEAVGDYGLALTTYREAWQSDPENLLFAQGLGRIERLRREHPQLQRQLESR